MRPLFRPEAVEAQTQQWLGRVLLVRPLSLTLVTAGIVTMAIVLAAFLSLAHYTRKASVSGVLVQVGAKLQAQLYAPSSAIGFVRAAQPVRLRYEAFPYQRFGHQAGHVVEVSRTPLAANELAALPAAPRESGREPMYRVAVELDPAAGEPLPLVAGMRLQADLLLERRRLVEWLFEPLPGFERRT